MHCRKTLRASTKGAVVSGGDSLCLDWRYCQSRVSAVGSLGRPDMEGEQGSVACNHPFPVFVSGPLQLWFVQLLDPARLQGGVVFFASCLPFPQPLPETYFAEPQQTRPAHRVATLLYLNRNAPGTRQHLSRAGDFLRSLARKAGYLLARTGAFSRCSVTTTLSCGSRCFLRIPASSKRSSMRPFQPPILPPRSAM